MHKERIAGFPGHFQGSVEKLISGWNRTDCTIFEELFRSAGTRRFHHAIFQALGWDVGGTRKAFRPHSREVVVEKLKIRDPPDYASG